MLVSLQAARARSDSFIDWLGLGFCVNRVNSSVVIGRLASIFSRLPLWGSTGVLLVDVGFLWLVCLWCYRRRRPWW